MRLRLCAFVAALSLVVGSTAKAEIYGMFTSNYPESTSQTSSLGLDISLLGLVNINIAPAAITGTATVDMNLDATNSGPLYVTGSNLKLANVVGSAVTVLGTVNYSLQNVGINLSAGPITVTNGAFSISNATVGALVLNSGTINLNGSLLIVGSINENIDLSSEPIAVEFSGLPAGVTLQGNADDDLGGTDTTDLDAIKKHNWPYGPNAALPGITGLSSIDNDGAEFRVRWNGTTVNTTLTTGTTAIPITVTLRGNGLAVGVPEASTVVMVGLTMAGFGITTLRRRRSA